MAIVINGAETFYNIYNKDFSGKLSFQPVSSLHLLSAFQNFGYEWYDKLTTLTIKIKSNSTLQESATKYVAAPHNDRKMTATMPWSCDLREQREKENH